MIGYYVHDHGRGHLESARAIAAQLRGELTALSSLEQPESWDHGWVQLDSDHAGEQASAPTAGGALHYAPLRCPGLRARMAQIADWVGDTHPALVVCDVSVEVACFVRLMGVPVISIALPGVRDDAPHTLGYSLSEAIVAPWPPGMVDIGWPARWREKTHAVGAFSRFDERPRPTPTARRGERTVTVMMGAGGEEIAQQDLAGAAAATPDWSWRTLGPRHWIEDPWPELCEASVIVTHAGQGCIGEVAAARRPAIVIPQRRPFDEQLSTARILERERLAIVSERWPTPQAWPGLLESALALGGERWAAWNDGQGARRAAAVIEGVAQRAPLQLA